jgi:hypothetical protein
VISIEGLEDFSERLKRFDLEEAEAEAMARAARDVETSIHAAIVELASEESAGLPQHARVLSTTISSQLAPKRAVIGSTHPLAVDQEFGTPNYPPNPLLTAVAQQLAPNIAERIGKTFVRLLSGE